MVSTQRHLKVAWGGSLGNPAVEVWTNSLAVMGTTTDDIAGVAADGQQFLVDNIEALATAIKNWFVLTAQDGGAADSVGTGISSSAYLEWVKLNLIDQTGHYELPSTTYFLPAKVAGGAARDGSAYYNPPWQQSTAITLRTTISRGRGSKGRVYPPMSGPPPAINSPYSSAAQCLQMANSFKGLIDNINQGLGRGYNRAAVHSDRFLNVCVESISPTTGPSAGKPALLTPVIGVEVDRVPDVQRRRVNRVPRLGVPASAAVAINT